MTQEKRLTRTTRLSRVPSDSSAGTDRSAGRVPSKHSRVLLLAVLLLLTGCRDSDMLGRVGFATPAPEEQFASPPIPTGTTIEVILADSLSSETALVGDRWHGTVSDDTTRQVGDLVPGGSGVSGEIVAVRAAGSGTLARLELGLSSIHLAGTDRPLRATASAAALGVISNGKASRVVLERGSRMSFTVNEVMSPR